MSEDLLVRACSSGLADPGVLVRGALSALRTVRDFVWPGLPPIRDFGLTRFTRPGSGPSGALLQTAAKKGAAHHRPGFRPSDALLQTAASSLGLPSSGISTVRRLAANEVSLPSSGIWTVRRLAANCCKQGRPSIVRAFDRPAPCCKLLRTGSAFHRPGFGPSGALLQTAASCCGRGQPVQRRMLPESICTKLPG